MIGREKVAERQIESPEAHSTLRLDIMDWELDLTRWASLFVGLFPSCVGHPDSIDRLARTLFPPLASQTSVRGCISHRVP